MTDMRITSFFQKVDKRKREDNKAAPRKKARPALLGNLRGNTPSLAESAYLTPQSVKAKKRVPSPETPTPVRVASPMRAPCTPLRRHTLPAIRSPSVVPSSQQTQDGLWPWTSSEVVPTSQSDEVEVLLADRVAKNKLDWEVPDSQIQLESSQTQSDPDYSQCSFSTNPADRPPLTQTTESDPDYDTYDFGTDPADRPAWNNEEEEDSAVREFRDMFGSLPESLL